MLKIRTVFQIFCVICSSICTCRYITLLHSGNSMVLSAGQRARSIRATKGEQAGYPNSYHHRTKLFHHWIACGINDDAIIQVAMVMYKNEEAPLQAIAVAVPPLLRAVFY